LSLAIKYENPDDARMRLRNTVVLYKKTPVLIQDVVRGEGKGEDDILRVLFTELPVNNRRPQNKAGFPVEDPFVRIGERVKAAEAMQKKYISSKYFDIAPFKLGYVNRKNDPFYCTRLPNRIQKQGLCSENFKAFSNFGPFVDFNTFLNCPETPAMIAGDYPSFDRAVDLIEQCSAVAFSRDFCLVKDEVISALIYLYYKGKKVGLFDKNKINLGKKFECLKESLEEIKIEVGVC